MFHRCQQNSGETIAEFVAKLTLLAEYCEFGDSLEQLCDKLVVGVLDLAIQQHLLEEKYLDFKAAMDIDLTMERTAYHAQEFQRKGKENTAGLN